MKKMIFLVLVLIGAMQYGKAQVFEVDTLVYNGDVDKYINIIILGDGYSDTDQNKFIADATRFSDYLFNDAPWSHYQSYFNIFAVKVISQESGTTHPNTAPDCPGDVPESSPVTYFDCSFDLFGIHRLIYPQNISNIMNVLAANVPFYDQTIIIANTPHYGGAGGQFATSTAHTSSNEIINHELGHSFGGLADEYYAGDNYAAERANMTQQTDPALVKWKNWVGFNGVGIEQHCCGGNSALWYRPHNNCKMRFLGVPYCSVCMETIVERIHTLTNPVVEYLPASSVISSNSRFLHFELNKLMRPEPNTLEIVWSLDGNNIGNEDSVSIDQDILSSGTHTLFASVVDTTGLVRTDDHASTHINTVMWKINKINTGVELQSAEQQLTYSLYPNPSQDILNISITSDRSAKVSMKIISTEGRTIQEYNNENMNNGKFLKTINIGELPASTYFVVFNVDGVRYSQKFTKQ